MLPMPAPIAVGSGAVYAMAVMSAKQHNSAEKGVEAAKRMCPYCGGDNTVWELPPPPAVPSKRPLLTAADILNMEDSFPIGNYNLGSLKGLIEIIAKDLIKKADEPTPEVK